MITQTQRRPSRTDTAAQPYAVTLTGDAERLTERLVPVWGRMLAYLRDNPETLQRLTEERQEEGGTDDLMQAAQGAAAWSGR